MNFKQRKGKENAAVLIVKGKNNNDVIVIFIFCAAEQTC